MTDREVMKMALKWMEATHHTAMTTYSDEAYEEHCNIEKELRQALAQPEQWVGLHWDDMPDEHVVDRSFLRGARWAEVKLKEKNT